MEQLKTTQDYEFLLRRLSEPLSDWAVVLPVAFALMVLGLLVWFRSENKLLFLGIGAGIIVGVSAVYIPLAILLKPLFSWWVVLAPMLGLAMVYVVLMYIKDAQSINAAWATFLGFCRTIVYATLAFVFLLPGCQNYETSETPPKLVFLLDVSASMDERDDLPEVGQDPAKLPTRQDKVIRFLLSHMKKEQQTQARPFIERIVERSPVAVYRFGGVLDPTTVRQLNPGAPPLTLEAWNAFLKPDKKKIDVPAGLAGDDRTKYLLKQADLIDSLTDGTDVPGSALQLSKLENNSYLQAIIVISDGQSNVGGGEVMREFVNRMAARKPPVQVYTIGVGEYRQPARIKVEDLQAPEVARPDDKFPIRVPVIGEGLAGTDFEVALEITRVEDGLGRPVEGEKTYRLGPKKGTFKGAGDFPQDTIDFEIDLQELKNLKSEDDKNGDLEGVWQFVGRVPRNPKEAYVKADHVNDPPTRVTIQKKKMRVLLFAGNASREYQFVNTLLYREGLEKRVEMCVMLQTGREEGVDQNVEGDRLLEKFPDRLGPDDARVKFSSLNEFDVVVAFDPDWAALPPATLKNLKDWVGLHAGGIVFVAGPMFTYQLARPGGLDLSGVQTLYPVVLKDSRLHGIGGIGHDSSRPYLLNFGPQAKRFDFLKLDEKGESPTAGWDDLFWGAGGKDGGRDAKPKRGIHGYYPVERIKPASIVVATFQGPESSMINDGKDQQPYMVEMPYGSGKSFYIGSGETWRLRAHKSTYHDRFWIKLLRNVSSSTKPQQKFGRMLLARNAPVGSVSLEAQIKGADLTFLPRDSRPIVGVKRVSDPDAKMETFELRAKGTSGDWAGWFVGSYKAREPGEYEYKITIPGTTETLSARQTIRKPNLEKDNLRNNFGALYQLASDAASVLAKVPADVKREVERSLRIPSGEEIKDVNEIKKDPDKDRSEFTARLFFPLQNADVVSQCITKLEPKRESVKGALQDVWDQGWESGMQVNSYWLAVLVPLGVGILGLAILLFLQQNLAAVIFLGSCMFLSLIVVLADLIAGWDWPRLDVNFSFVLIGVVSLLGIEWLTRKLLKLA